MASRYRCMSPKRRILVVDDDPVIKPVKRVTLAVALFPYVYPSA